MLNSLQKGEIGQLKIQIRAAQLNYICSTPTTEVSYDLILDKNNKLFRCQIKFCNRKGGRGKKNLELNLTKKETGRKFYTKNNIDLILVFIPKLDVILAYPPEIFHKKSYITINLVDKQSKWFYGNYIWK